MDDFAITNENWWEYRRELLIEQIERTIPADAPVLLADDEQLAFEGVLNRRRALPLMERDGTNWGVPQDAAQAIAELERHRAAGVRWLIVAWPLIWYLEVYADLRTHLYERYAMRSRSPHAVIFELT